MLSTGLKRIVGVCLLVYLVISAVFTLGILGMMPTESGFFYLLDKRKIGFLADVLSWILNPIGRIVGELTSGLISWYLILVASMIFWSTKIVLILWCFGFITKTKDMWLF